MDPQELYLKLGHLINDMPVLDGSEDLTDPKTLMWLGRAKELTNSVLEIGQRSAFEFNSKRLFHNQPVIRNGAVIEIRRLMYQALAAAEALAPAGDQGTFIPIGAEFTAMAAVGKVLGQATSDALIVDPYMDEKALTDFALQAEEGLEIRLLADQKSRKSTLEPAVNRWKSQFGSVRPLDARLAPARSLHDRLIVLDSAHVWNLSQSLNAIAARSHASIIRVDPATAKLKVDAYEDLWRNAAPI